MNTLFRVLYAAHARGTHHKLALDGLRSLTGPQADAWRCVFLKHAELLMTGSKAPDDSFKDFKNHVLHPRENFWGGAPPKVRNWYGHVVAALRLGDWATAAYAAGVMSHYLTDPLHPFHTGQSQAENDIHRAVEWSINRSYDALWKLGETLPEPIIVPGTAENWLEMLVCDGALIANAHYERLIAHYDFKRGVVDPPAGLDEVAQRLIAGLIVHAATTPRGGHGSDERQQPWLPHYAGSGFPKYYARRRSRTRTAERNQSPLQEDLRLSKLPRSQLASCLTIRLDQGTPPPL